MWQLFSATTAGMDRSPNAFAHTHAPGDDCALTAVCASGHMFSKQLLRHLAHSAYAQYIAKPNVAASRQENYHKRCV